MAGIATRVKQALQATSTVTTYATGGIYDRDIRRTGSGATPFAYDPDGDLYPTVMVDDAGDVREPFSHTAQYQGLLYIWVFAGRSTKGEAQVAELTRRIRHSLFGWQDNDPTAGTGALLFPNARLGVQADDDAVFDRLSFTVSGVYTLASY